ncbi:NepR family anti-sigma factor [Methylobacterium sp. UNC378MF]|uniref:NepR family anti-sigma factor n=1 Tax=Methylobacterium sp. UNC378MF TaxID=1502748 RepID=UPI001FCCFA86|nr:NepR family anti-sigma factor [Methylobacterium sp. UNC378MF]
MGGPVLDAQTRTRLGHQMRAMYDPVIDEALDPRLAELLQQLDADRGGDSTADPK